VGSASSVSGAVTAVKGVSAGGAVVRNVQHEYELCFRCHGDSAQRGPARITRQFVETDTRRQFNPGNASFHPVEAAGKNSQAPSLIPPLTTASHKSNHAPNQKYPAPMSALKARPSAVKKPPNGMHIRATINANQPELV